MTIKGKDEQAREARIRLGTVGDRQGACIGAVHRMTALLDNQFNLVAYALSSTPENTLASGRISGSTHRGPAAATKRQRPARRG